MNPSSLVVERLLLDVTGNPSSCFRLDDLKAEHGWDTERKVFDGAWSKLKLGVHYEAEVTSSEWGKKLSNTPNHRLTQVLAEIDGSYWGDG